MCSPDRGQTIPIGRTRRLLLGLISTTALALGIGFVATPANASTTSNICEFGVFIAVRGTDAPAGTTSTHGGRAWTAGGTGDQIAPLKTSLAKSYLPFYFESLSYPAAGGGGYPNSVNAGSATLMKELDYLSTACGSIMPAVVLAGHSQGADVIANALSRITARAKTMVRAVVLYGDPAYLPNHPFNAIGDGKGEGVLARPSAVWSILDGFRFWGWPQVGTSKAWVYKVRSYCKTGDAFCQSGLSSSARAIHNSYTTATADASSWIMYMLTSAG